MKSRSGSLTSQIYEELRRDIVSGALAPGERLRLVALCARFNVGGSPIREALSRLAAERLASYEDQKGFQVTPISREDFLDLTRTRCQLNEIAIRETLARGDARWEESVVVACHRLNKTPSRLDADDNPLNPEWEPLHRAFHQTLVNACGSPWLLHFCELLFDYGVRYRILVPGAGSDRAVADEHRELMEAAIKRDADTTVRLLNDHVRRSAEEVERSSVFERWGGVPGTPVNPAPIISIA